ncbi:PREDICTED: uncharacterized protein LOC108567447 [Nicrophorus vespilloides]|uniref:Uncharacterized protein LOC108567447 n=1 Tax=Nicrophorus vespilloides TaxID=110193 RepID=A0ABM1N9C2_NICVS|nr:PREDICTED: uncharacterized protein LOC108567447 [Nicrophorus vespilloides]
MLVFLFSIVLATASGVVLFLFLISGDFQKFRDRFVLDANGKPKPYIKLANPAEIDLQLDVLKFKLDRKQTDIESSKGRVIMAAESIQKLSNTSNEVKKYYVKLKEDIMKSEQDCRELQTQIDEFKRKQHILREQSRVYDKFGETVISEVNYDLSRLDSKNTVSDISTNSYYPYDDFSVS